MTPADCLRHSRNLCPNTLTLSQRLQPIRTGSSTGSRLPRMLLKTIKDQPMELRLSDTGYVLYSRGIDSEDNGGKFNPTHYMSMYRRGIGLDYIIVPIVDP